MKKTLINSLFTGLTATFLLWGCLTEPVIQNEMIISGKIIENSGCKNLKSDGNNKKISPDESCLEYTYSPATGILNLKHLNAGFNCCPDSLFCEVAVKGDTLIIQEFEKAALCRCNCLYDLEIEIQNLDLKTYQVKVIEPYAQDQKPLAFRMDLPTHLSGSFCVYRSDYPWGIY